MGVLFVKLYLSAYTHALLFSNVKCGIRAADKCILCVMWAFNSYTSQYWKIVPLHNHPLNKSLLGIFSTPGVMSDAGILRGVNTVPTVPTFL